MAVPRLCSIPDCGKTALTKGWCPAHYSRWKRNGDPTGGFHKHSGCDVPGCANPHLCRGYCSAHYQRWKNHGDPLGGLRFADNSGSCEVEGCANPAATKGLCRRHHHKLLRYGDPTGGASYEKGKQLEWLKRVILVNTDECIEWPFSIAPNGYGMIGSSEYSNAHQCACILAHGTPPTPDHEVAHSCNVRRCVNRRHIRWATKQENMADKLIHGTQPLGERVHTAKLTNSEARKLIAMRWSCTLDHAAKMFGVSITTVWRIWRGSSWKWLQDQTSKQQ